MADYSAQTRSNYFKVKDQAAFRHWASSRGLDVSEGGTGEETKFAIFPGGDDEENWPTSYEDEATDTEIDLDIEEELAHHLKDGSVAVLMTVGHMGCEDLYGYAVAFNNRGEEVQIDIHEICDRAAHLGTEINPI